MKIFSRTSSRGFTLIELLVVIFIIGLLASIVVVSVNTARAKSRDARRIADLSSIRTAIEMYIDANGSPPGVVGLFHCTLPASPPAGCGTTWDTLQSLLSSYIPTLPKDPRNGQKFRYMTKDVISGKCEISDSSTPGGEFNTGRYIYQTNGTNYEIMSLLEAGCNGINITDGGDNDNWYEVGSDLTVL